MIDQIIKPDLNKVLSQFNKLVVGLQKVIDHHTDEADKHEAKAVEAQLSAMAARETAGKAARVQANVSKLLGDA